MKMRQSIVWAFAVALLAGAATPSVTFAAPKDQDRARGPAMKAIEMIQKAAESDAVKLDDDQKTKVHAIIEDANTQAKAMQEDAKAAAGAEKDKADKKQARDGMMELMTQTKQRVEEVLNEEQKTAFRTAFAEERNKAKAERGDKGRGDKKKPAA